MLLASADMEEQHVIVQPENDNESLIARADTDLTKAQPDFTSGVFGNSLLFHRLTQYLDIPDLKILRQTCKLLMATVNELRNFTSNLQVTVTDKNIDNYRIAMGGRFVWKNVVINISSTSPQHFLNIPTEWIEDLYLAHPLPLLSDSLLACYELLESRQFPNLRSLCLDMALLWFEMPLCVLSSVVGMGKLQDFRLIRTCTIWVDDGLDIMKRNLEIIGGLPWKLRSIDFCQEKYFPLPNSPVVLGRILASSASTLESITVHRVRFEDICKAEVIRSRIPRLRNIQFKLAPKDGIPFAEFLRIQPPLESMCISVSKRCPRNEMFDPTVLDAIKRNATPKLHTLRLIGPQWPHSFPELESWEFIRDLTGLKDLAIEKVITMETMSHLPTAMQDIGAKSLNCQEGNSQVETLNALFKFSNLLRLDLDESVGLVDDAALQSICTKLTNLRLLHFGSTELTDFGITGQSGDNNSGVSLRNLKGLRDLKMRPCGSVSTEGLLKSIQLSELRKLELGVRIPTLALLEMASNNPGLEFLSFYPPLHLVAHADLKNLYHDILEVCPRIATLRAVVPQVNQAWQCFRTVGRDGSSCKRRPMNTVL